MAINVTFGGETYSIPEAAERNWANLTDYLVAISQNALTSETFTQNIRQDSDAEVTVLTTDSIVIIDNVNDITLNLPASNTEGKIYSIFDVANTAHNITIANLSETFSSVNNAIQIAFTDGAYKIISNLAQIDAEISIQVSTLQDTVDNLVEADIDNKFAVYMRDAVGALVSTYQTSAIRLPVGTIAQRPTAQQGLFRFNSESGNVEVYNGTVWKQLNTADLAGASLSDLNDVNVSNPQEGESLGWNGSAWTNNAATIDKLSNVEITTPSKGQGLVYDDVNNKWINGSASLIAEYTEDVSITAEVNKIYLLASTSSQTLTLPSDAKTGEKIGIVDLAYSAFANTNFVNCSGIDTFVDGSVEGEQRADGETWILEYNEITNKWYLI